MTLEFDKISFNFEKSGWDCNFSLKLNNVDSLGIIGSSGAGKSTLLNLAAGFIKPKSGKILIDAIDITNQPPSQRPISMLFQENNLFSHLNVYENVAIGINPSLKLNSDQLEEVYSSLERVGLKSFSKRYPAQLSGGQKQRIAIARCLVRKASIVLLDEPFSFLDPPLRVEMLDLVKELQKERKFLLVMVSHEYNDCLQICNKIAFMDHGNIIHLDSTKKFEEETLLIPKITEYISALKPKKKSSKKNTPF